SSASTATSTGQPWLNAWPRWAAATSSPCLNDHAPMTLPEPPVRTIAPRTEERHMRRWMGMPIAAALALTACVTINVYFPAAEAREAAKEFVDKVIGEDAQPSTP